MDNVKLVVSVSDILKKRNDDVHIILAQNRISCSPKVALYPIQYKDSCYDRVTKYNTIPISEFCRKFRVINIGCYNSTSELERKLYYYMGHPMNIGEHNWIYECDDFSDLIRMKNFLKIRFNTNKFIHIISIEDIDDGESVLYEINNIVGYL